MSDEFKVERVTLERLVLLEKEILLYAAFHNSKHQIVLTAVIFTPMTIYTLIQHADP
jgi:hypothetical protein